MASAMSSINSKPTTKRRRKR